MSENWFQLRKRQALEREQMLKDALRQTLGRQAKAARRIGISPQAFSVTFQILTGQTPTEWFNNGSERSQ